MQVVGLTASIGTGGSTEVSGAKEHIIKIMANMAITTHICMVRRHTSDLSHAVNHAIECMY